VQDHGHRAKLLELISYQQVEKISDISATAWLASAEPDYMQCHDFVEGEMKLYLGFTKNG